MEKVFETESFPRLQWVEVNPTLPHSCLYCLPSIRPICNTCGCSVFQQHLTSSPPWNQAQDVPLLSLKFPPLSPFHKQSGPRGRQPPSALHSFQSFSKKKVVSCPLLPTLPKIKWTVCTIPANICLSVAYTLPPHTCMRTQFKMLLQTSPPHMHLSTTLTLSVKWNYNTPCS